MRRRLALVGISSISNVVDITNITKFDGREQKYTIFDLKKSNIKFTNSINDVLSLNMNYIEFEGDDYNNEICFNEESKSLVCFANLSKSKIRLEFIAPKNEKREIRIEPKEIVVNKGKGCEVNVFIKPLCTCNVDNDKFIIRYLILKGDEQTRQVEIPMKYKTIESRRLDYDELIEEMKLREETETRLKSILNYVPAEHYKAVEKDIDDFLFDNFLLS